MDESCFSRPRSSRASLESERCRLLPTDSTADCSRSDGRPADSIRSLTTLRLVEIAAESLATSTAGRASTASTTPPCGN
eukprot:422397-Prymnesium_polylepis.1